MRRLSHCLLLATVIAAGAAACGTADPLVRPTPPSVTVTETFSGSFKANSAVTHPFVSQAAGTVTATLSAVTPAVNIGLSLGTWDGTVCTIVKANDNATPTAAISGDVTSAASLCVRLYDVGNVTDTLEYTVTVVHPG
jgi:hypothetical protein